MPPRRLWLGCSLVDDGRYLRGLVVDGSGLPVLIDGGGVGPPRHASAHRGVPALPVLIDGGGGGLACGSTLVQRKCTCLEVVCFPSPLHDYRYRLLLSCQRNTGRKLPLALPPAVGTPLHPRCLKLLRAAGTPSEDRLHPDRRNLRQLPITQCHDNLSCMSLSHTRLSFTGHSGRRG